MTSNTGAQIIDKAKEMGASMAGIANVEILKKSPSHEIIKKLGMEIDGINPYKEICDFDEIKWPAEAKDINFRCLNGPYSSIYFRLLQEG